MPPACLFVIEMSRPSTRSNAVSAVSVSEVIIELFQTDKFLQHIKKIARSIAKEIADQTSGKLQQMIERNESRIHDLEVTIENREHSLKW